MDEAARGTQVAAWSRRLARCMAWALVVLVLVGAAGYVGSDLLRRAVWDDAYMFVRYADHLRAGDGLRWNPGEPPTYGLTALLYVVPVTVLRALAPESDDFAVLWTSVACGVLLLCALARLVHVVLRGVANAGVAWLLITVGVLAEIGPLQHCATGMDTTFALLLLTLFLVAAARPERRATGRSAIAFGASGGLLYAVRPDLLLFPAALLLGEFVAAAAGAPRRRAFLAGATALAVVAAQLALAQLYFGSALPLPFYAKAVQSFEPALAAKYEQRAADGLRDFLLHHSPLVVLALSPLLGGWRRLRRTWTAADLALLLATVAFLVWYRGFVVQVMHMGQRFYYPTLPPLVWLAARAAAAWLREPPRLLVASDGRLRASWRLASLLALVAALTWTGPRFAERVVEWYGFASGRTALTTLEAVATEEEADGTPAAAGDGLVLRTAANLRVAMFLAREFDALPADLVVAGTEIGFVGLAAGRHRVVDLCGLHDADIARHGFSADRVLEVDRPDVLYFPHPDYRAMRTALFQHPRFVAEWEKVPRARRGPYLPFALRKTSPHYQQLKAILARTLARSAAR